MDLLLQQTNRSLLELHHQMDTLVKYSGSGVHDLESSIVKAINELYENCTRLEDYLFKEPSHRKQTSKLKVDQILYDVRHIEASYNSYIRKRKQREEDENRRQQLLNTKFKTNAESNDTKIALDYALQHHDALQSADKNIGQMLYTGSAALDQMRNQRMSLKGVRKRILDIGNTLGLSNTVMRMIDKRGTQDKWIVYGCIVVTLIIIFLTLKYLT